MNLVVHEPVMILSQPDPQAVWRDTVMPQQQLEDLSTVQVVTRLTPNEVRCSRTFVCEICCSTCGVLRICDAHSCAPSS